MWLEFFLCFVFREVVLSGGFFGRKFTGLVTHFNNFFIRPQIIAAAVRSCKIEDNRLYFNKKQQNKLCGRDKAHIWQEIQGFLNKVVPSW